MNLYGYIDKYKEVSFERQNLCEIDMLIFSQLSYIWLNNIDFKDYKKYSLLEISNLIDRKKVKEYIYAQKKAIDLLDVICKTKRYSKIKLFNYEYIIDLDMQFGALTLELPDEKIVVSFEGTDNTFAGWKEDAILAYQYPTLSQIKAGEYLNNLIKYIKKDLYVCGHSKGANLALVGSMRTKFLRRYRIKEIYSFDGPGLKEKEFTSLSYKSVRKKLKNIIPNQSLVGILFEQENIDVIKSNRKGLMQHAVTTWEIEDNYLIRTEQSKISKELDQIISNWLGKYNDQEKEKIVTNIFILFEEAGLEKLSDLTNNKIKSIFNIIKISKLIDTETKLIVINCLKLLVGDIGTTIFNEELNKLKGKLKK